MLEPRVDLALIVVSMYITCLSNGLRDPWVDGWWVYASGKLLTYRGLVYIPISSYPWIPRSFALWKWVGRASGWWDVARSTCSLDAIPSWMFRLCVGFWGIS